MKLLRLAVLVIALGAGGLAAMLVGGSEPAPAPREVAAPAQAEVLVAASDIALAHVVAAPDLAWRSWPLDGTTGFITREAQPGALEENVGALARQPIAQGEPISAQKIVKRDGSGVLSAVLPAGMRAVATEISAETGAGGFILPNDRVDVILTHKADQVGSANAEQFLSSTILKNVRILAIDQTVSEKDGEQVVIGRTATLELLPRQSEILALARQTGTLSLALRPLADANPANLLGGGPEDGAAAPSSSTNEMTVIRYGVATSTVQR